MVRNGFHPSTGGRLLRNQALKEGKKDDAPRLHLATKPSVHCGQSWTNESLNLMAQCAVLALQFLQDSGSSTLLVKVYGASFCEEGGGEGPARLRNTRTASSSCPGIPAVTSDTQAPSAKAAMHSSAQRSFDAPIALLPRNKHANQRIPKPKKSGNQHGRELQDATQGHESR